MYILKRTDGAYVAKPGSAKSYTRCLQNAQTFTSREEADRNRCPDNETITTVDAEMR